MVRNPKPSAVKRADNEVREMCQKVRHQVEKQTSKTFSDFTAICYRTLVDYEESRIVVFIKVQVGDNEFKLLRVFRQVPSNHGEVTLEYFADATAESDPLEAMSEAKTEDTTKGLEETSKVTPTITVS